MNACCCVCVCVCVCNVHVLEWLAGQVGESSGGKVGIQILNFAEIISVKSL